MIDQWYIKCQNFDLSLAGATEIVFATGVTWCTVVSDVPMLKKKSLLPCCTKHHLKNKTGFTHLGTGFWVAPLSPVR